MKVKFKVMQFSTVHIAQTVTVGADYYYRHHTGSC